MAQRICPNCRYTNPSTATICRECGFNLGRSPETAPTESALGLGWIGTPLDWVGLFFSGGLGLRRFCRGDQNWNRFIVDMVALAILNGLLGLLTVAIALNIDSSFSLEITDIQLELGVSGDFERLVSGVLTGLGLAFVEVIYVAIVYGFTLFFDGKGDLSDHFHLFFSATLGRNLFVPAILALGVVDIRLFIVAALLSIVYSYYLYVRIIQGVHRLSLPLAILPILIAPVFMNAILNFI